METKEILWVLQHTPTPAQIQELGNGSITMLSEIEPKLYTALANSPSEYNELCKLADQLYQVCQRYDTVVLPIGSPAFNFIFASSYNTLGESLMAGYHRNFVCAFAHSKRVSQDNPDGTKTVRFNHEKFIYL